MNQFFDFTGIQQESLGLQPHLPEDSISKRQDRLESLKKDAKAAQELMKSEHWPLLLQMWQEKMNQIIGTYNPSSPTAMTDAVYAMGRLRQIHSEMNQHQVSVDKYQREHAIVEKMIREADKRKQ